MKPGIVLIPLIFLLYACSTDNSAEQSASTPKDVVPVQVTALQSDYLQPVIQTAGVFTTDDETFLSFKTGGIIEKIFVKEGDPVHSGQVLATLNPTEINAQVAQAELAFEKATRDFNRVQNLYKDSVATLEQFQNARTGLEVAGQQLESAKFNRAYSEIRATRNGMVLRKLANEGQVIAPGNPVVQTNGAGSGKWILKAGVSDREWSVIQTGDKAIITSDALTGKTLEGSVTKKSATVDAYNGALQVEITLSSNEAGLAAGLFGKASITATQKQQVWKIPYEALLDGDANTGYVFIANAGQAHKVPVTVAGIDKKTVLISGGLQDGQQLIVSGSAYLKEGTVLQVVKH
ncbi:MAG: efflux RND transporter periplasmic adaptor subunit [Cyclobacteriaceae bacterium]|nr:efflux RND transporter periplasmic adaptor subunit [Cyclobacteriaceae bacterium]